MECLSMHLCERLLFRQEMRLQKVCFDCVCTLPLQRLPTLTRQLYLLELWRSEPISTEHQWSQRHDFCFGWIIQKSGTSSWTFLAVAIRDVGAEKCLQPHSHQMARSASQTQTRESSTSFRVALCLRHYQQSVLGWKALEGLGPRHPAEEDRRPTPRKSHPRLCCTPFAKGTLLLEQSQVMVPEAMLWLLRRRSWPMCQSQSV